MKCENLSSEQKCKAIMIFIVASTWASDVFAQARHTKFNTGPYQCDQKR